MSSNCQCSFDVHIHICVGMFSRVSTGPFAGGYTWVSSVFSSYDGPGGDSRNGWSVVRDKVLVKSQAGNETIHPREPSHAEVDPRL